MIHFYKSIILSPNHRWITWDELEKGVTNDNFEILFSSKEIAQTKDRVNRLPLSIDTRIDISHENEPALKGIREESIGQIDEYQKEHINEIENLHNKNAALFRQLSATDFKLKIYKILLSLIIISILGYFVFLLSDQINWPWFQQHAKKMNLQIYAMLVIIGVVWIIFDSNKKRRLLLVGSLLLATFIAIIQIL